MRMSSVEMLIFTRFSIPSRTGFRVYSQFEERVHQQYWIAPWFRNLFIKTVSLGRSHSTEDVAEFLYRPSRMERRFFLFEKICLPSLAHQSFQEFRHIVLASKTMPEKYQRRLAGLKRRFNFEIAYLEEEEDFTSASKRFVNEEFRDEELAITCRLDDDDALGRDTLGKIYRVSNAIGDSAIVSLAEGFELGLGASKVSFKNRRIPFLALGLTYLERMSENPKTIFGCGDHTRASLAYDSFIINDKAAFIMTTHRDGASARPLLGSTDRSALVGAYGEILREQFGIDLPEVLDRECMR